MVNADTDIIQKMPSKPRLCYMERGPDGYGFNLHGERGQHGQYIRAVDADSPADLSGLRQGDRVVEVNGVNIERETHSQVVTRIREGGNKTCLLVINHELDVYCRKHSITVKESMAESSRSSIELSPMHINGDDEDLEVHMNGDDQDATDANDEAVVAHVDTAVEAVPDREEEEEEELRREATPEPEERMQEAVEPQYDEDIHDHGYAEIQRRDDEEVEERREEEEEKEEEEEEMMFVAAEAETGEAKTAEIKAVSEEVIQPQQNTIEESVPAPPQQDREEESDANVPEPEPEPVLEAATVPMVESAPPPPSEPEPLPEPEPVKAPAPPAPVVEPPKKTEAPAPPRPTAAPTPTPTPDQRKSEMEKARILAAGRKKKKEASKRNWEDKYATFNNL